MKTAKRFLVIFAVMAAMVFAIAGCSSQPNSSKADPSEAFIGTWHILSLSQDGTDIAIEDLETMRSYGMDVTCEFKADKTMSLDLFGDVTNGTWKATSETEGTINVDGQEAQMTIKDGKLTFSETTSNNTLTFERISESASAASASASAASTDAAASASGSAESTDAGASEASPAAAPVENSVAAQSSSSAAAA